MLETTVIIKKIANLTTPF